MFPSSSTSMSSSLQNPFEYSCSINENPNPCFLNFPTRLLDDDDLILDRFLHHHHHHQREQSSNGITTTTSTLLEAPEVCTKNSNETTIINKKETPNDPTVAEQQPKAQSKTGKKRRSNGVRQTSPPSRRTGKKDRHSKIYTAQGPRDRRMRLSLQIARKFFDLQDMLGFDKASKTIEWLFTMSKAAIRELTSSLPPKRTISCRSVSSSDASESIGMEMRVEGTLDQGQQLEEMMMTKRKAKSSRKGSGNSSSNQHPPPSLARESRDKARARARQRTREKMLQKDLDKKKQLVNRNIETNNINNNNTNIENLEKLGSSDTTPENGDDSVGCEIMAALAMEAGKCRNHQSLEHQMASVGIMEKLLGTSRSSIYDYENNDHEVMNPVLCSSGMMMRPLNDHELLGFSGNWVAENARMNSSGYGGVLMNIAATAAASPLQDQQNPNSFFMSTSSGNLYLQSQYLHNYFFQ